MTTDYEQRQAFGGVIDGLAINRALSSGFFNVIQLRYHIKSDLYVPVEPEFIAKVSARVYLPFDEMRRAAYLTAKSTILTKLRAYENCESTQHLDDIASIVRLQGKKLDQKQIDIAAAQLGLLGIWCSLWESNKRP